MRAATPFLGLTSSVDATRTRWETRPLGPENDPAIRVLIALGDQLLGGAIRMRLDAEPDVTVVAAVQQLGAAAHLVHEEQVDVLVLGSALVEEVPGDAIGELLGTGEPGLVLISTPSATACRRLVSGLPRVEVVSPLESPDRLLAAIRAVGR